MQIERAISPIIPLALTIVMVGYGGECSFRFKAAMLAGQPIGSFTLTSTLKQFGQPRGMESFRQSGYETVEMKYENIGTLEGQYTIVLDKKMDRITHVIVTPRIKDLSKIEAALSARVLRCRYLIHSCDFDKPEGRIVESPSGTLEFVEIPDRGLVFHLTMEGRVGFIELLSHPRSSTDPPCATKR